MEDQHEDKKLKWLKTFNKKTYPALNFDKKKTLSYDIDHETSILTHCLNNGELKVFQYLITDLEYPMTTAASVMGFNITHDIFVTNKLVWETKKKWIEYLINNHIDKVTVFLPLQVAVLENDNRFAKYIIENLSVPNRVSAINEYRIKFSHDDKYSADVKYSDSIQKISVNQINAFYLAIMRDNKELVQFFLHHGAIIKTNKSQDAVEKFIQAKHENILKHATDEIKNLINRHKKK
jgi:hypothetical protein